SRSARQIDFVSAMSYGRWGEYAFESLVRTPLRSGLSRASLAPNALGAPSHACSVNRLALESDDVARVHELIVGHVGRPTTEQERGARPRGVCPLRTIEERCDAPVD